MALSLDKVTLCWPNYIDLATLSGGSYEASRPLANAQVRELQELARTTDATTTNTKLTITLDKRRTLGAIGIAAHNLSSEASIRFTIKDDNPAIVHQSEWLNAWPSVLGLDQLEWEDDNFWLGQLNDEQRAEYTALVTYVFDLVVASYTVEIEIDDTANADGYVEFGRLFIGPNWQPENNMSYGAGWGTDDSSTVDESEGSEAEFFDEGPRRRTFNFALDVLDVEEAYSQIYRMQNVQGTTREVIVIHELQDTPQKHQRTMLARLQSLDPLTTDYHTNWRNSIRAREIR